MRVSTALVFETDVRRPVRVHGAINVGGSPKGRPPVYSVMRKQDGDFRVEQLGRQLVQVNGRRIPERPLRDGDEIVFGSSVAVFRQATFHADLEPDYAWDELKTDAPLDFISDVVKVFSRVLDDCGQTSPATKEHLVEDWRTAPIDGPHFGFGRRRTLLMDQALSIGIDRSEWDMVGSGAPVLMRQRLVSIGLPDAVIKWELSKRSRALGSPFSHDVLVAGWRTPAVRATLHAAIVARVGKFVTFAPAGEEILWRLHHTDRILSLPGGRRHPDDAIYSTISSLR